jgi:hypothetical protein
MSPNDDDPALRASGVAVQFELRHPSHVRIVLLGLCVSAASPTNR